MRGSDLADMDERGLMELLRRLDMRFAEASAGLVCADAAERHSIGAKLDCIVAFTRAAEKRLQFLRGQTCSSN